MAGNGETSKREVRSFLFARDPSIDRRFRPRPDRSVRLFADVEEDDEDSESLSSLGDDTPSCSGSSIGEGDTALVYLRLRPVDQQSPTYMLSDCGNVLIVGPSIDNASTSNNKNQMEKHYSFSDIFNSDDQQCHVFEKCIGRKIEAEENFTVLTYGTSGSGKTFTLLGDDERPGIIPRSLENIFTLYANNIYPHPTIKIIHAKSTVLDDIASAKEMLLRKQILNACADMKIQYSIIQQNVRNDHNFETLALENTSVFIWISFVEIYNEFVYDLLEPPPSKGSLSQQGGNGSTHTRKNLKIMGNDGKVFIKGLTSVYVKNCVEALKLLRYGLQKVNYASTSINANSSRSHCVFTVNVIKFLSSCVVTETTYKFCDLAGSERLDKTGNIGSRLKEAQRINTSLLVLGRCLDAANAINRKKNPEVIPYRESKLTMLLQSALLGKEKLSMIVNLTPTDKYYEENLNVLGFSSIAKNIIYKQPVIKENKSRYSWLLSYKNQSNKDCATFELEEQICCLRNELEHMKIVFEEEKELRERQVRNELVDFFEKELEERKKNFEIRLKQELELQKTKYEAKIEALKKLYEEEIDYSHSDIESDEISPTKSELSKSKYEEKTEALKRHNEEEIEYLRSNRESDKISPTKSELPKSKYEEKTETLKRHNEEEIEYFSSNRESDEISPKIRRTLD